MASPLDYAVLHEVGFFPGERRVRQHPSRATQPRHSRHQIGMAVREQRLVRGLSQKDLALAIHVKVGYVADVEMGREQPSKELLRTIERVLMP